MNRLQTTSTELRAWLGLLVVLGPVLLVAMDGSVLFLAMPAVTAALAPTADQSLWILDSYGFAVGSLLIAFGTIGDRYGRKRLLLIGTALFGLGSVGAAFAPSPELLIAFRVLMGVAGATLLPSALAVLGTLFTDPRRRAQAIGIFAATFAAGFAIGPVVAGQLLSRFWWGSVLLINAPVVLLFLVFAPILLGEVRAEGVGRIDAASVLTSAAGLLAVMYAVKHTAAAGFSVASVVIGLGGVALLGWFGRRQGRIENPLIDFGLFRNRVFAVAIVTGFLPLAAWSATAYLAGTYLQSVLGLSVSDAALLAVPGALVLTVAAVVTPAIVTRIGRSAALITAHFSIAIGLFLLLPTGQDGGIGWYVAATAVAGIGYGISFSVVADIAVAAVPPARAGSAAALAETGNELGNALGIALFGSLAAVLFRLNGPDLAPTLGETLSLPGLVPSVLEDARAAFVDGLHVVALVAGALHAILGVIALRVLRDGAVAVSDSADAERERRSPRGDEGAFVSGSAGVERERRSSRGEDGAFVSGSVRVAETAPFSTPW
ncbi:MFS transporter [Nocardia sp. NPDC050717]|uniref:MFS transporter n=1 Tax=Nocardia sp. NPDC050717 TaxID=3157221 RepID=UPI0033E00FF5